MTTDGDNPPELIFGPVSSEADWFEPVFRSAGLTYDTGPCSRIEPDPVPLIVPSNPQPETRLD